MAQLYESYNVNDDSQQRVGNGNVTQESQTFTAPANFDITSVKLKIWKAAGASGTMTVELKAVDGSNKPTGAALSSGTIGTGSVTDTAAPGAFYEITMSAYTLVNGTQYALIARADTVAPDDFWWRYDNTSDAYAGSSWQSIDSGATWSAINYDFMFEVYGVSGFTPYVIII